MIWFRGEIVSDEAVTVNALDRSFEHGLGLFETFRTWNGHPTLLDHHLDRMRRSARELGLTVDPGDWPDESAVCELAREVEAARHREAREAEYVPPDVPDMRLRLVLTGGPAPGVCRSQDSALWMTAVRLIPGKPAGARILRSILADPEDPLARHKTLNYWRRRIEQERAAAEGADEVLSVTPDGRICEGIRSNLFLVREGRLVTPSTDLPILPGVMRQGVIDRARVVGMEVVEGTIRIEELPTFQEAFLTNSVRGMSPVGRVLNAEFPAPGPITVRLWEEVRGWLESGRSGRGVEGAV